MDAFKKIAVLMAVKDGVKYLPEQIKSVFWQAQCEVTLFISDDASADGGKEYVEELVSNSSNIALLGFEESFGSAGKNFYRLIQDVDLGNCDYIAFSDQDDIWEVDKLIRHVELMRQHQADMSN